MKNNYLINYTAYDSLGKVIKEGTMRAKGAYSKLEAKVKFEQYLKRKYPNFSRLVVHGCTDDFSIFDQIFK